MQNSVEVVEFEFLRPGLVAHALYADDKRLVDLMRATLLTDGRNLGCRGGSCVNVCDYGCKLLDASKGEFVGS